MTRFLRDRPHGVLLLVVGFSALAFSSVLIRDHLRAAKDIAFTAVPLVERLPALEQRKTVLTEQVELAEIHASLRTGSLMERIRVFVLPEVPGTDRVLTAFDLLRDHLSGRNMLGDMSSVTVGEESDAGSGVLIRPFSVSFSVTDAGVENLFTFLRTAGMLTVGDALTEEEQSRLLRTTETENPANLLPLEQFLSADLFSYSREPRSIFEQLERSLRGTALHAELTATVQGSFLKDTGELFGGTFGEDIERYHLWPLPLLRLQSARVAAGRAPGWHRVDIRFVTFRRG